MALIIRQEDEEDDELSFLNESENDSDMDQEASLHDCDFGSSNMWNTEEGSSDFSLCPGKTAEKRLQLFHDSWAHIAHMPQEQQFQRTYNIDDFHYGRVIGKGSFSTAHQVYLRPANNKEDFGQAYALKKLQARVYKDRGLLKTASADIALEAAILTNLKHDNIITLHGVQEGDMIQSLNEGTFFLVLDLLVETLDARLAKWSSQRRSFFAKTRADGATQRLKGVALGIAEGMKYLHSKHIIFRDLKPANIGFDENDEVKIFDFGLSREIDEDISSSSQQHTFHQPRLMTGGAGTPRYMAPEVAKLEHSYGFPADVYSFTILLWQIITTQTPFANISSPTQFAAKVIKGNARPPLKCIESKELRNLLHAGWSVDPDERPTFSHIRETLNNVLTESTTETIKEPVLLTALPNKGAKKNRKVLKRTTSDPTLVSDRKTGLIQFRRSSSPMSATASPLRPLPEGNAIIMSDRTIFTDDSHDSKPRGRWIRRGSSTIGEDGHKRGRSTVARQNQRSRWIRRGASPMEEGSHQRGLSTVVQQVQRKVLRALALEVKSERKDIFDSTH